MITHEVLIPSLLGFFGLVFFFILFFQFPVPHLSSPFTIITFLYLDPVLGFLFFLVSFCCCVAVFHCISTNCTFKYRKSEKAMQHSVHTLRSICTQDMKCWPAGVEGVDGATTLH